MTIREIEHGGRQNICTGFRLAFNQSKHATRFRIINPARDRDRITSDIHQCSAADLELIANVCRIGIEVTEETADRSQRADAARLNQPPRFKPLRMCSHHEGFLYSYSITIASIEERPRLI